MKIEQVEEGQWITCSQYEGIWLHCGKVEGGYAIASMSDEKDVRFLADESEIVSVYVEGIDPVIQK